MDSPSLSLLEQEMDSLPGLPPFGEPQSADDQDLLHAGEDTHPISSVDQIKQDFDINELSQPLGGISPTFSDWASHAQFLSMPPYHQHMAALHRRSVSEPPCSWQGPSELLDPLLFTQQLPGEPAAIVFHRDGQRLDTSAAQRAGTARSKRKRQCDLPPPDVHGLDNRRTAKMQRSRAHLVRATEHYERPHGPIYQAASDADGPHQCRTGPRSSPYLSRPADSLVDGSDTLHVSAAVLKSVVKEAVLDALREVNVGRQR